MSKVFHSSVDCVIVTDRLMTKMIELAESWGKKTGSELQVKHKEKHISRVAKMQARFVEAISKKTGQFWHDEQDEKSLLNVAKWVTFKHCEMQGFTEPLKPVEEGVTFSKEALRSPTPTTTSLVDAAFGEFARMMSEGQDPVELSKENILLLQEGKKRDVSDGGIVLG